MGRRRKISDLPIPNFDRDCRRGGNIAFNFGLSLLGLAYYAYKSSQFQYKYTPTYTYHIDPIYDYKIKEPRKYHSKSTYEHEIAALESMIKDNIDSIKQCKRLAEIYYLTGDFFKERYARLCVLRRFFYDNNLGYMFDSFLDSFNDQGKRPPMDICDDDKVNIEYRKLLSDAERASERSMNKFKYQHK